MILTKLCFLWTLWLPDMVPQTPDEDPSLNADDVTGSQMLPFTSHSCHQPPVSSDHHTISRMIHCFLQTYKCCNCCMFTVHTTSALRQLIVCGFKCHSEDDVYSGPRMTGWWHEVATGQQTQVHQVYRGTLVISSAGNTSVTCSQSDSWMAGAHSRETALVQTRPICTSTKLLYC